MNKFKILIPSYNNSEWVEYNIASILNQTYQNFEVFYIDDASPDDTYEKVLDIVGSDKRFTVLKNEKNLGGTYNALELPFQHGFFDNDEDIVLHLDGDDWLYDETVLEKLNKKYIENDWWTSYGQFLAYDGITATPSNPQGTKYSDYVHKHSLYRRDYWRASHLRTQKVFLYKKLHEFSTYSKSSINNQYFCHAADLMMEYMKLEICPIEKIGVLDFISHVWNCAPKNRERTLERESTHNNIFEEEIRNRKQFKRITTREELFGVHQLPQINIFGDYSERHTHPTKFTYCYNRTFGDFDITIFQDDNIEKFIKKEICLNRDCIKIAMVCEHSSLFNQKNIIQLLKDNYQKFDYIFTHDKDLLLLPNAVFKPISEISQFNLLPDIELDMNIFQVHKKNKLISTITSNKSFSYGHQFRLDIVKKIKAVFPIIDLYGRGFNEISTKLYGLKDYMFSLTMENTSDENYFTEKILDCFLTGTIPIYYGCTNIGKYFNINGIITFNSYEELEALIPTLNEELYNNKIEYIKENFNKCFQYALTNDMFYELHIENLLENKK